MPSDKTSLSKILVIGSSGAGKTALIDAFKNRGAHYPANNPHPPHMIHVLQHQGSRIIVHELFENSSDDIKQINYNNIDAILFVVDLSREDQWHMDKWVDDIKLYNKKEKPVFLIATRTDACNEELSTENLRKAAAYSKYPFKEIFITSILFPNSPKLNQSINIESKDEDRPCHNRLGILNFVLEKFFSSSSPAPKTATSELGQIPIAVEILRKLCLEEYPKVRNYGVSWLLSRITCSQRAGSYSMRHLHTFCKDTQNNSAVIKGSEIMDLLTNQRRKRLISFWKDKQSNVPESPPKDGTEKIIRQIFSPIK